jgi:hypothetical protein
MAGRPTDYDKDVVPSMRDYIEKRRFKNRVPSIEGLAVFLDVHRDTLYEWAKHHPESSDILDALGANLAKMLIDNGLSGRFNADHQDDADEARLSRRSRHYQWRQAVKSAFRV